MLELLFDPFDLDRIEVRPAGKPAGTAVPFVMGRHRHPKTRTPDGQARTDPVPTGIDYLAPSSTATTRPCANRSPTSSSSAARKNRRRSKSRKRSRKSGRKAVTDSPPNQTLALARTAAGAVRSLNHATLGGEGLAQPADAYELIGELALAAARPPAAGPGRPVARIRPRRRPWAATTAPARLVRSAAPGCSSPTPGTPPPPWPATSAPPSSSSPPSTADRPRKKQKEQT